MSVDLKKRLKWEMNKSNSQQGYLDKIDGFNCDKCKNKGWVATIKNNECAVYECECIKKRLILNQLKTSGLEEQFKKYTFDNFSVGKEWQKNIKDKALLYVDKVKNDNNFKSWFIISGQIGTGKTHIATAISHALIMSGKTFTYFSFAKEMPRIQLEMKTFTPEQAKKRLNELQKVNVLYIDDFMKTQDMNYVFEIIDGRYVENKITIISTEKTYNNICQIDYAIASRLAEKSSGFWLENNLSQADDQRLK